MLDSVDAINPSHYKLENGVEVIDLTEQFDFCTGSIIKYCTRAGKKDGNSKLQDLLKAQWYLNRLIAKEEAKNV